MIHELLILNGLRWQIRAINWTCPHALREARLYARESPVGDWFAQMKAKSRNKWAVAGGGSRFFGSGFRLFLRVVSCESAVVRKKLPFPDAFKVAVAAAETGLPFYRGVGLPSSENILLRQIPPNFQRFARQDRLGLSEPYLEICSLIEEKRLKMLLEAGILAWSDDLETAYGVVNWLFTKVETKKRCQNEFVLTAKRLNFGPIMQEKSAT